jgi:hypothetical protein
LPAVHANSYGNIDWIPLYKGTAHRAPTKAKEISMLDMQD